MANLETLWLHTRERQCISMYFLISRISTVPENYNIQSSFPCRHVTSGYHLDTAWPTGHICHEVIVFLKSEHIPHKSNSRCIMCQTFSVEVWLVGCLWRQPGSFQRQPASPLRRAPCTRGTAMVKNKHKKNKHSWHCFESYHILLKFLQRLVKNYINVADLRLLWVVGWPNGWSIWLPY